jgi:hypothetical protein
MSTGIAQETTDHLSDYCRKDEHGLYVYTLTQNIKRRHLHPSTVSWKVIQKRYFTQMCAC